LQPQLDPAGKLDLKQAEEQLGELSAYGVAVVNFSPNRLTGVVAVECKSDDVARAINLLATPFMPTLAEGIGKALGITVKAPQPENANPNTPDLGGGAGVNSDISPPRYGSSSSGYGPPPGSSGPPGYSGPPPGYSGPPGMSSPPGPPGVGG